MTKYRVIVRFYGRADLRSIRTGKFVKIFVENPKLVKIIPFSGTPELFDRIGIYEFIPVEEKKEKEEK